MQYHKKHEKEIMVPTLAYMNNFNRFMTHVQKVNQLKELNTRLDKDLSDKIAVLDSKRLMRESRIKELKEQILKKKQAIDEKSAQVTEKTLALQKIDKFGHEKTSENRYYQEVFKAFRTKLGEDQKTSGSNL